MRNIDLGQLIVADDRLFDLFDRVELVRQKTRFRRTMTSR